MNETGTTLRTVLADHAATVGDAASIGRADAVRRRVAVVRRRRRAAVAGVAAVAVVAAGVAVALPNRHDVGPADAPSRMVGRVVPQSTTSLGAQFRYAKGYVGHHGKLTVKLPARSTGYLVRMASSTDVGRLRLSEPGASVWSTGAGAFGTFYAVAGGDAAKLTVSHPGAPGDVALAVYTLAKPAPGSYVRAGVIYPAAVAGEALLGAAVGAPGQASLSVPVTGSLGSEVFYTFCSGLPKGARLKVTIDGQPGFVSLGSGCTGAAGRGFAAPDTSSVETREPVGDFTARIAVTDVHDNAVRIPSSARIGLGIYPSVDRIGGLPKIIDTAGHRWVLGPVHRSAVGQQKLTTVTGGTAPTLLVFGSTASLHATAYTTIGADREASSGGGREMHVLATGQRATVVQSFSSPTPPKGRLYLATYQLLDE